jgi:hypothetical protein
VQLRPPAYWTPRRTVSIRTTPGKEKSGITRLARPYGHLFRFALTLRFADRGRAVWGLAEPTPENSGAGNTEGRVKTHASIKFRGVPTRGWPADLGLTGYGIPLRPFRTEISANTTTNFLCRLMRGCRRHGVAAVPDGGFLHRLVELPDDTEPTSEKSPAGGGRRMERSESNLSKTMAESGKAGSTAPT